jgi:hypothetical protein
MSDWEKLFTKTENSGVYAIAENAVPDVNRAAAQAGLALFCLNLADINEKGGFLDAAAKALNFPHYFGSNWDAFEDCLTDLSWIGAKGYFLLIQNLGHFSHKAPKEMSMARAIFQDAAAYWKQHNVRFFVGLAEEPHG